MAKRQFTQRRGDHAEKRGGLNGLDFARNVSEKSYSPEKSTTHSKSEV